jgi:DNA-binding transcriptional regulator LsrR (DeoR family)
MRIPDHPTLIRRAIEARRKQLAPTKPPFAASLSQIRKNCGRPSCHCLQGGPLHTAYHLTYKVQGKTHTVYVPVDLLDEVRSWIEEHRRLKRLLREVQQLTLALVRTHVQARRRRPKRS